MKIAVYYDTLINKGGAERVAIELANGLNADLITSGYDSRINEWLEIKTNVIDLGNSTINILNPIGTLFEAPLRFFFNRNKLKYDKHIFIGFSSIYGSNKDNENYWFCLTPNRMLYDLKESKLHHPNLFARIIFWAYSSIFTYWDQLIVKKNFKIITVQNSIVKDRVQKYYNKDSIITSSPVNTKKYYFRKFGDFFLCVSRLFPEKRVDLVASVFTKLKNKKLVIVGSGPEDKRIKKIIKDSNNIKLIENCSENELLKLYSECLATIYMPLHEDYGLIPLEGMSAGKACIGVDEGGLKETIINGKTGYRIKSDQNSIIRVVNSFMLNDAEQMKENCFEFVKTYDINKFISIWQKIIS